MFQLEEPSPDVRAARLKKERAIRRASAVKMRDRARASGVVRVDGLFIAQEHVALWDTLRRDKKLPNRAEVIVLIMKAIAADPALKVQLGL